MVWKVFDDLKKSLTTLKVSIQSSNILHGVTISHAFLMFLGCLTEYHGIINQYLCIHTTIPSTYYSPLNDHKNIILSAFSGDQHLSRSAVDLYDGT